MNWLKQHVGLLVVLLIGAPFCIILIGRGHWEGFLIAGLLGWAAAIFDSDVRK